MLLIDILDKSSSTTKLNIFSKIRKRTRLLVDKQKNFFTCGSTNFERLNSYNFKSSVLTYATIVDLEMEYLVMRKAFIARFLRFGLRLFAEKIADEFFSFLHYLRYSKRNVAFPISLFFKFLYNYRVSFSASVRRQGQRRILVPYVLGFFKTVALSVRNFCRSVLKFSSTIGNKMSLLFSAFLRYLETTAIGLRQNVKFFDNALLEDYADNLYLLNRTKKFRQTYYYIHQDLVRRLASFGVEEH
jgi:hypothetical protein